VVTGSNCDCLILLVGSNPLPNYLTASALRPREIVLIYTGETKCVGERLRRVLERSLGGETRIIPKKIDDANSACAIVAAVGQRVSEARHRGKQVWLNYTGGTKVMAAHAVQSFLKEGGCRAHCCYLDEGVKGKEPRLRFDDGRSRPLSEYDVPFGIETLIDLHGVREIRQQFPATSVDLIFEDAQTCLRDLLNGSDLCCVRSDFQARVCKKLGSHQASKVSEGSLLEAWVAGKIRQLRFPQAPEIKTGFTVYRGDEVQMEIDVAVVRGHRSYFISCTVKKGRKDCKLKLFEVAIRARQLGGDLSRAALVCLREPGTDLQAEIDDLWGSTNAPRVFTLSDVQTWLGYGGTMPNVTRLQEWLEN